MEIKIKNLAKRYSGNVEYTLENINLDIESGEFIVLLGPSGCGKTTLLRMIAGLNSITKGELIFDGTKVNNVEPKNRDLAMVFQSYALYPHLSIYKNMAYSLKVRGYKRQFIDTRVRDVAKILEIDHLLFNKPSEISGGQRQRVALGRAIVRKPKLFLMDEPLSNLDAKLRETMRLELVKIHGLVGATTIYVTHDQLEAMTMADRIVLFNDKKIQQVGRPSQLYNKPEKIFVAKFIGSPAMNIVNLVKKQKNWVIENTNLKINLGSQLTKILQGRTNVVLGIRGEDIKFVTKNGNMTGKISGKELIGKETIVSIDYTNKKAFQVIVPGETSLSVGQQIKMSFNEKKVHLFDEKTESRIN